MVQEMKPVNSWSSLISSLNASYNSRYPGGSDGARRMTGILFARPNLPLAKMSVVDNLDYFHQRSGKNIDFFCAGYDIYPSLFVRETGPPITRVDGVGWYFSNIAFNDLREKIEHFSNWNYRGGVELLLINTVFNRIGYCAEFQFDSSIVCDLDKMIQINAIDAVESFFESIFKYAERCDIDDPTWGFSDQQGGNVVVSALKRLVLSVLPNDIGEDVKKACNFAVVDLSKK